MMRMGRPRIAKGLKSNLNAAIANSKRGQVFAFIVAMTVLVGSMGLIALGTQLIGFALVITSLAVLVGVFVYTRKGQAQQLGDAQQAFPSNREGPDEQ